MEAIEKIMYKGRTIETFYDQDADSPDNWGNDEAFIVYDHRDFMIKREGFDPDDIFHAMQDKKHLYEGCWYFPVYAYIHSGVSLSLGRDNYPFTCNWDTSFKGFVLVKRMKGWSWAREKARVIAQSIVDEWNMYLSGDVYGYDSEAGGCWGFYGKEGYKEMILQAKKKIDYDIQKANLAHFVQLKKWIKGRVPLQYRKPLAS